MILSRLYTNHDELFRPIRFLPGLNVVLADIRHPENYSLDTHNLGKTTLASLIDFCLLKRKSKRFFLFKHANLFDDFVFYLEILTDDNTYLTIRRAVSEASKISFLSRDSSQIDASRVNDFMWDHWNVSFRAAKELLNAKLDFSVAKEWDYRKPLGYALRLQGDYSDVFQLAKFKGEHQDWKPFLAELIGLDGKRVKRSYELANEIAEIQSEIDEILPLLCGLEEAPDKLEGLIIIQEQSVDTLTRQIETFNFEIPDKTISRKLVKEIENNIAMLNDRRYQLEMSLESISESIETSIAFDMDKVEKVFHESNVYFGDQIKHEYAQLVEFITSISEERNSFLVDQKSQIEEELSQVAGRLEDLNQQRVDALSILRETETLKKFRMHTDKLVGVRARLRVLENQRTEMARLAKLRSRMDSLVAQRKIVLDSISNSLTSSSRSVNTYHSIRTRFASIVEEILEVPALLSCKLNKNGNLEFFAEFLDKSGEATSMSEGHTYHKLLCIAFDMAVFMNYKSDRYVRFAYHDGLFESLDDRKKLRLLKLIHEYCADGLQQIVTLIKADLPVDAMGNQYNFSSNEIVRLLHDEGNSGRLFNMPEW